MAPTLYMVYPSPPVRAVLMTAKAIGLDLNLKEVGLLSNDHLKSDYLKLNPQHTVPTLVDDNGFTIWDSHATMTYLVTKYAKDDSLYPKDPEKRALVDQRLHFESGIVFARLLRITKPLLVQRKGTIDKRDLDDMIEAYTFLERFLQGKKWATGDFVTLADYSLGASISSIGVLVPIDPNKFPNVTAWLKRLENLPEYEANRDGLALFSLIFKKRLSKL
ncbi:hypothetical protein Zmor_008111 [Zophobas morio]|uniref:Uncharacterized protein n=1 Tax=Zophobas morio TaxID=2755281 RepID=A0AA38MQ27_9CUCU|nr:hypothetical protein Zmor_008111 [Zophobas morio]